MNEISIIPVGSGSTGNSIYIEIGKYHLLIDMGIGFRKLRDALSIHDRNLNDIDAIFLTHSHHDHIKAAEAISNHTCCKVFAHASSMFNIRNIRSERVIIDTGIILEILPGLLVKMFPVSHDFAQTCGFTFSCEGRKIGYVTDCGKMNENIIEELSGSDLIIIEANHDLEMLKNGPYPLQLQKRIRSKYGHLSNDECADTIAILCDRCTKNFLLAHISLNNNTPERALNTVRNRLGRDDVFLYACPADGNDLLTF